MRGHAIYDCHRSTPNIDLMLSSKRAIWNIQHDAKHILTRPKILTTPLQVIKESPWVREEWFTPKACKEPAGPAWVTFISKTVCP